MCQICRQFQEKHLTEIPTAIIPNKPFPFDNEYIIPTAYFPENPNRKEWKVKKPNYEPIEMTFLAQVRDITWFDQYGTWIDDNKDEIIESHIQTARYQIEIEPIEDEDLWKEIKKITTEIQGILRKIISKEYPDEEIIGQGVFPNDESIKMKPVWFLFKEGTGKSKETVNIENDSDGKLRRILSEKPQYDFQGLPMLCKYENPLKNMDTKQIRRQEIQKGDHIVINVILESFVYYSVEWIQYGIWPIMTFIGKIHDTIHYPFCGYSQDIKVNPKLYNTVKNEE